MLKVAVLGSGVAAAQHADGYLACSGVELTACADRNLAQAEQFRRRFRIPRAYADYTALLEAEQPDIVSVCTPSHEHTWASVLALDAGCHVLCAGPMALSSIEADRLGGVAESRPTLFSVSQPLRFAPAVRYAKRRIDRGDLGRVFLARTRIIRQTPASAVQAAPCDGSVLLGIGQDILDLTLYLMGSPEPVSVSGTAYGASLDCVGSNHPHVGPAIEPYAVPDYAAALVRMDNGATLLVESGQYDCAPPGEAVGIVISGEHGEMRLDPLHAAEPILRLSVREPEGLLGTFPSGFGDVPPHVAEMQHWIACVRGEEEPLIRLRECVSLQRLTDALFASHARQNEVATASVAEIPFS